MSANWSNFILSLKTVGGLVRSINEADSRRYLQTTKLVFHMVSSRETDHYFPMSFKNSNLLTQKRILALIHSTESICQPKLSKF